MGYAYELIIWVLIFAACQHNRANQRAFLHLGLIGTLVNAGILLYGIEHTFPEITYQLALGSIIAYVLFVFWLLTRPYGPWHV